MIYLDNAATTNISEITFQELKKYYESDFYNPSSKYRDALRVKQEINEIRNLIASKLGANSSGIYFTPSATIGNNTIIQGFVSGNKKCEYVFSCGEHPSVYNCALKLKEMGCIVKFISLKSDGTINEDELLSNINENTRLVSVIHVSNETGAINDINALADKVKSINDKIIFHSDGVQAFGKINIDLKNSKIDCYTVSAHKIGGLKGIGAIYVKNVNQLKPIIVGGGQENNVVSGTENVIGILSFKTAIQEYFKENNFRLLKDKLVQYLSKNSEYYTLISNDKCSPHIVSFCVNHSKGEVIVRMLDELGIQVGTGSACSSSKSGNRILENMGLSKDLIVGALRVSFGIHNTLEDVEQLIKCLDKIVKENL